MEQKENNSLDEKEKRNSLLTIWKDPVFSKVIAFIIISIGSWLIAQNSCDSNKKNISSISYSGRVVNENGQAVSGVKIQLGAPISLINYTDNKGKFSFSNQIETKALKENNYVNVVVSHNSYNELTMQLHVDSIISNISYKIVIKLYTLNNDEIEVSGQTNFNNTTVNGNIISNPQKEVILNNNYENSTPENEKE